MTKGPYHIVYYDGDLHHESVNLFHANIPFLYHLKIRFSEISRGCIKIEQDVKWVKVNKTFLVFYTVSLTSINCFCLIAFDIS